MDIYGVPESDEPLMMDLTQGIFGANDPEFLGDAADPGARVMGSVMEFIQYFNEITQDRRACPADDLACGEDKARAPHPAELFANDWQAWSSGRTASAADRPASQSPPGTSAESDVLRGCSSPGATGLS